jgi:hypothetical protein
MNDMYPLLSNAGPAVVLHRNGCSALRCGPMQVLALSYTAMAVQHSADAGPVAVVHCPGALRTMTPERSIAIVQANTSANPRRWQLTDLSALVCN